MKFVFLTVTVYASCLIVTTGCGTVKSLGKSPRGEELAHAKASPNYKNGTFQNLVPRGDSLKLRNSRVGALLRSRTIDVRPTREIPWVSTDLKAPSVAAPTIIWFGHSSLLIKTMQGNMLIDPVFSNHAGPVPGLMKAFKGTTHYTAKDMPPIDVLIISHDHYDHLDYRTLKKLKSTIKMAVVPVGVGSHLIYWGFDPKKIIELNWNQSVTLMGGLQITATPAQHHSNRSYTQKDKTLWASYVLQAGKYRIYYGGDGGYGPLFKQIGKQYGPFNLALLECGQYGRPYVHLGLGETARAALDLRANMIQPIHWAKFPEAEHPWNEPIKTFIPAAKKAGIPVNIPRIGEPYTLGDIPKTTVWWNFK